jgi:hypothetical protein
MSAIRYPESLGDITYAALRPTLDVFVVTWIGDSPLSRAIRRFAPGGSHTSIGLHLYGSLNMLVSRPRYGFRTLLALAWRKVRMTMRRPVCSQAGTYILVETGVIEPQFEVLSPGRLRALLPRPWRLAPYSKEGE